MQKLWTQLHSDLEVWMREWERSTSFGSWEERRFQIQEVPLWASDLVENGFQKLEERAEAWKGSGATESRNWLKGVSTVREEFTEFRRVVQDLSHHLKEKNFARAYEVYSPMRGKASELLQLAKWSVAEHERELRNAFQATERQMGELRTGLQGLLGVFVGLSLLLLWVGERALRPLGELTGWVRDIARRGIRKEDKRLLPVWHSSTSSDEVSELAREFHHLATALLEREKTVAEHQRSLQVQNELLKSMSALQEAIFQALPSLIFVSDSEGRLSRTNPAAQVWLEKHRENTSATHVQGLSLLVEFLKRAIPAETQGFSRVDLFQFQDSWVSGYLVDLNSAEKFQGRLFVIENRTEERLLAGRLHEAEELAAMGRMSAQIAHDVRNPLHAMGLEAALALKDLGEKPRGEVEHALKSILQGVERLTELTENYLRFSRGELSQTQSIHLAESVEKVLATYANDLEEKRIRIQWKISQRSRLRLRGDASLMQQALSNLLKNAIEATRSRIQLQLGEGEGGTLWLKLEDDGPGILPENRERIFSPFFTTKSSGTGLGLSFVRKVMRQHGGEVSLVESKLGGAAFLLSWPMESDRKEEIPYENSIDRR
jgi:signal transduction histidine kinase